MSREFDEKRDFIRMGLQCELTFKTDDMAQAEHGEARNLSGRGMMFVVPHALPIESSLEVTIRPDNALTPPLHAIVKVVRVVPQRRGEGYEIGAVIQNMLD